MLSNVKKNREKILYIILSLFICGIVLADCFARKNFYNYDEVGYMGIAQFFAGNNWNSVISKFQYYSFVYPFLISIIIHILPDGISVYPCILVLNCLILEGIFFLTYRVSGYICSFFSTRFRLLLSFFLTTYSSNIVFTNIIMPEILMTFLFWFGIYLIIRFYYSDSIWFGILIGITSVLAYYTHQRMLGFVVSLTLVLALIVFTKKKNIIPFMAYLIVMLFAFLFLSKIKTGIQENLWLNSKTIGNNDVSGQIDRLRYFMEHPEDVINLFFSLSGKIYYLCISSWGLFLLGIIRVIEVIKKNLNKKIFSADFYISILLFFTLSSSLAICVFFLGTPTNETYLFYGRYNEFLLGPYMLAGIVLIMRRLKKYHCILVMLCLEILLLISQFSLQAFCNEQSFYGLSCIGLYRYFNNDTKILNIYPAFVAVLLLTLALYLFSQYGVKIKIFVFLVISVVWIKDAALYIDNVMIPNNLSYEQSNIIQKINNISQNNSVFFYIEEYDYLLYKLMSNIQLAMTQPLTVIDDIHKIVNNAQKKYYVYVPYRYLNNFDLITYNVIDKDRNGFLIVMTL